MAIPLIFTAATSLASGVIMISVGSHDVVPVTVGLAPSGLVVRW